MTPNNPPPPSIDQIISTISATNFGSCVKPRDEADVPLRWPFVKENLPLDEWNVGDQPKTELEVGPLLSSEFEKLVKTWAC